MSLPINRPTVWLEQTTTTPAPCPDLAVFSVQRWRRHQSQVCLLRKLSFCIISIYAGACARRVGVCVYALEIVSTDALQILELLVLIITAGRGSKEDVTHSSLGQNSHVADIISILMHSHICIHTQPVAILFF